jgi:hypothetical protein
MAMAASAEGTDDPQALAHFLLHLETRGFLIGTRDRINCQTLWLALAARQDLPAGLHERLALLRPLLCRTPRQQHDFVEVLRQWTPPSPVVPPKPVKVWRQRLASAGAVASPRHADRYGLALLLLVGALLLLLALLHGDPGVQAPAIPPAPWPNYPIPDTVLNQPNSCVVPPAPALANAALWLDGLTAAGWLSAVLLFWLALRQALRRAALQTVDTRTPLRQVKLFADNAELLPRGTPLLRQVARELRRPLDMARFDLDITRTVAATVRAGGMFSPRYRPHRGMPEYLVLIERHSRQDQFARLAEQIVGVLVHQGVAIDLHQHAGGSAQCEPVRFDRAGRLLPDATRAGASLSTLLASTAGHRVLMFGEAASLLDPFSVDWRPGLSGLAQANAAVLFTPRPVSSWGRDENFLAQNNVLVLPTQLVALATAAEWLESKRALLSLDPNWPATYPPRLRQPGLRWVAGHTAPAQAEIDGLLFELQVYLGPARMQWLCACAVFPVPSWPVSLAMRSLFMAEGSEVVADTVALAALPWFRQGVWPVWLRTALLGRLVPEKRQQVEARLLRRLEHARLGTEAPPDAEVIAEVAIEHRLIDRLRLAWRRRVAAQWVREMPGALRRDVLFLGFVQRGAAKKTMQLVPPALRQALFRESQPLMGLRVWVPALGLLLALLGAAAQMPSIRGWVSNRAMEQYLAGQPLAVPQGLWDGIYRYATPGKTGAVTEVTFSVMFKGTGGRMAGFSVEPNTFGESSCEFLFACLSGAVTSKGVDFVKTYDGRCGQSHSVLYQGRMDADGRAMAGEFRFGAGEAAAGSFELKPRPR